MILKTYIYLLAMLLIIPSTISIPYSCPTTASPIVLVHNISLRVKLQLYAYILFITRLLTVQPQTPPIPMRLR